MTKKTKAAPGWHREAALNISSSHQFTPFVIRLKAACYRVILWLEYLGVA